jgi:hypothetical protein
MNLSRKSIKYFALMSLALSLFMSNPALTSLAQTAQSNEPAANPTPDAGYHDASWSPTGAEIERKKVYLFTADFPQNVFTQFPSPPLEETTFWKLLNKEMASTSGLVLTSDPEKADYRVEMRCSGVFNCSRLIVDVKSPERNPLTSFSLTHVNRFEGLGSPQLNKVSHELAQRLDEHIRLIPRGGYGYSGD